MKISFEARRLYVAPRKSVLFFARSNDEKIRCYVQQDALIEPARGLREESGVFQRCLLAFDQHRRTVESAAKRLIEAKKFDADGGVTISRAALALDDVHDCVDQGQVGERLREVAQVAAAARVDLLGVELQRAGVREQSTARRSPLKRKCLSWRSAPAESDPRRGQSPKSGPGLKRRKSGSSAMPRWIRGQFPKGSRREGPKSRRSGARSRWAACSSRYLPR